VNEIIPVESIEQRIFMIPGQKVMLDSDLAELYAVETKMLNRAVKRNIDRFPGDFMFQLTKEEYDLILRYQIGTLKRGRHRKYLPYVFTENGVAMLSGVLNSKRAINANIQIMRTFTKLRKMLASNAQLARKVKALEKKYDEQFRVVFEAIYQLMDTSEKKAARKIGFER
jgi:phage regulator Rha-like protein